ncbi:MAG: ABC transporter ATP-binding protein [Desulfobulbaceae bacterium]|jgi:ABC-2 type transport system ATP-binding protein|nr:ABC transporter ATP-binding protein [Desulfobulbaceae bacterium]
MIAFENVSKQYNKELFQKVAPALVGLSFSLSYGKTLGLIGANGAGKSTSIRLLMDFIRPDSGQITLFGRPAGDLASRHLIGYLPETASFPANLNILDMIRFTAATCGMSAKDRKERGETLLRDLNLWEARKKPLRNYSKGMQQRANFVLALLNDPRLLILDEPMSGLDPLGRNQIITLIQNLKGQGKTILFCSHILSDVDRLVDELLVLHQGRCLFHGAPETFLQAEGQENVEAAYLSLIAKESAKEHHAV